MTDKEIFKSIKTSLDGCSFELEFLERYLKLKVEFINFGLSDERYKEYEALECLFNSISHFTKR